LAAAAVLWRLIRCAPARVCHWTAEKRKENSIPPFLIAKLSEWDKSAATF
jgi:hypothetical protein